MVLRESGMTQPAIAEAMGVSLSTVNRAHKTYDHGGLKALKPKPIGGRQRENMTLAEEKALLKRFAKAAGAGEMLNIHDLKAAYEKAIGHETSNSMFYNLLARHSWRKLMPRPFHPKRNIAAQNSFKKNGFPNAVRKARRASARRGRRLRLMFADEARFGRINRPRPCWARNRYQARGRLPAHSRIHLLVRRGLSEGRGLRLSDDADIEYGGARLVARELRRNDREALWSCQTGQIAPCEALHKTHGRLSLAQFRVVGG